VGDGDERQGFNGASAQRRRSDSCFRRTLVQFDSYGEKEIPPPHRRSPGKVLCTRRGCSPVPHLRCLSGRSEASHRLDARAPRRLLFARRLHGRSARGEDCLERDHRVWSAVHSRETVRAASEWVWPPAALVAVYARARRDERPTRHAHPTKGHKDAHDHGRRDVVTVQKSEQPVRSFQAWQAIRSRFRSGLPRRCYAARDVAPPSTCPRGQWQDRHARRFTEPASRFGFGRIAGCQRNRAP
jgi:hypothetical protein